MLAYKRLHYAKVNMNTLQQTRKYFESVKWSFLPDGVFLQYG